MSMNERVMDQENRPFGGGPLGRKPGGDVGRQRMRPVLGEISQNVGRTAFRTNGNKSQGSFSIFCDDSAPAKPAALVTRSQKISSHDSTADKENHIPREAKVVKCTDVLRVQQQTRIVQSKGEEHKIQTKTVQLLQQELEPMNTSLAEESPMVVDTEVKEQWRVPPIKDNHTVDIFTEPEYFQDIYRYLKNCELKNLPKWNYMAKQTDITHTMRSILVDWLVEVGEEYKLQTETLHLAVSYIDRFLSYMAVQRSKLQLVGAACMFIAAKYEEIYPPDVSEFVYITDDTYTKRQVLRMEHLVLKVLDFELSSPTTFLFLNKILEMEGVERALKEKLCALSAYLAELSLVDGENFLKYKPSLVAAASVALARHTLDLEAWSPLLQERSGFQLEELKECFVSLHACFQKAEGNAQQAVREKYKATKYFGVSELSPPSIF